MRRSAFLLVFPLLSCAQGPVPSALPNFEMMGQDFCYREAQVENDFFGPDKDMLLREMQFRNGDRLAVVRAAEDCQKDMESFFSTLPPEEKKKTQALCEFVRIEDYRKLNRALAAQVEVACTERAEDLCLGLPVDSRKSKRACIERNEPHRIEALGLGELSIGGIE